MSRRRRSSALNSCTHKKVNSTVAGTIADLKIYIVSSSELASALKAVENAACVDPNQRRRAAW